MTLNTSVPITENKNSISDLHLQQHLQRWQHHHWVWTQLSLHRRSSHVRECRICYTGRIYPSHQVTLVWWAVTWCWRLAPALWTACQCNGGQQLTCQCCGTVDESAPSVHPQTSSWNISRKSTITTFSKYQKIRKFSNILVKWGALSSMNSRCNSLTSKTQGMAVLDCISFERINHWVFIEQMG